MKRFSLFLLLLLMSLRLVASGVSARPCGVEAPGKKAHCAASGGLPQTHWLLAETNPAEESEEDPTGGFHATALSVPATRAFASALTVPGSRPATPAPASAPPLPLFLLFQNFRI